MKKGRVVVAMSGGVDSSVAAYLLKRDGYDVVGITMKLWDEDLSDGPPRSNGCCSVEDVEDARRVCQIIGAPHYVMDFQKEFQTHVIDYFSSEYQKGRTPYPCLACNDKIKFDFLMRKADALGFDYVATGHYARLRSDPNGTKLLKGLDNSKDQSYVLFNLRPYQVERLMLPLGWYDKADIRKLAKAAGLPVADKPDSQDICFIPQNDYRSFLSTQLTPSPGDIVDSSGRILGRHKGIEFFTVGQRRGLGINSDRPLFVINVDSESKRVVVGHSDELLEDSLWASDVNFISGCSPQNPIEVDAKIRYKSKTSRALVDTHRDWALVEFLEPQRAITPGQAVVFYDGDEVLGGGFIEGSVSKSVRSRWDSQPRSSNIVV